AVGVPAVVDFYRQFGIHPQAGGSVDAPDTAFGASLTLGGYPVTLLQEAGAVATMADMGLAHQTEAILSVTDPKGSVLYQADPERGKRQVVEPGVPFIVGAILSDDANRAPIFNFG